MTRTALVLAIVALGSSSAAAADRLTDKDVKALVSKIEEGRNKFDDALDDKLKGSIVRGPGGEVNVKDFLNDFQENIDRLEERLKPEYAASSEVTAVLRQATTIENFFKQHPAGTKGESEWNRLATDMRTLARAYGADFPLPPNAAVRRIGDHELATSIDQVSKAANQLKKSLDNDLKKDKTIDKSTREAIVGEADQLSKDAKELRDKVKDGKPSSAEAERLLAGAAKVQSFIGGNKVPTAAGAWAGTGGQLKTLASAYGAPWPPAR
jgi:hypothetical protein